MKEQRHSTLLITEENTKAVFERNLNAAIQVVEDALKKRSDDDVLLPDKISQIFDQKTQNRINCMPATLVSDQLCGVKWVAVFPENPFKGVRNVHGTMILSEIEYGRTISVMDATYLTNLRTASVGAVAAKYLAREDSESIGFIGAGSEARRHLDMIKCVRPGLKVCYVSSRRMETVESFIEQAKDKYPEMDFISCGNDYREAVQNADIIVTATSTQADLLKADWIKEGATYIHVGGWEDEYAVAQKAAKIVCDEWESIKHRTQTISRMFKEGLLKDEDIYADLGDIVCGKKAGRENSGEFIYFCSVGLAFIDVMFAKYVYETCKERGLGIDFVF